MIHPLTLLKGAGLGAGMMYFFDPVLGNRRRDSIRDKFMQACNTCSEEAVAVYRNASDRLQDVKASVIESSDQGMMERVQEGAQGVGRTLGMQGENWSPTAKAAVVLAGAGLVASMMKKRDLLALALGGLGLTYVVKEMADQEAMRSESPWQTLPKESKKQVVHNR